VSKNKIGFSIIFLGSSITTELMVTSEIDVFLGSSITTELMVSSEIDIFLGSSIRTELMVTSEIDVQDTTKKEIEYPRKRNRNFHSLK
jgi:hypothetical protein